MNRELFVSIENCRVSFWPNLGLFSGLCLKLGFWGQLSSDSGVKMDSEAQNPSQVLATLLSKRTKLQDELRGIEKQVYDLETTYLQDPSQCGNVLKGFEGFLSSSKSTAFLKRSRKFQPEDRLFSLSSVTSPAAEELTAGRDDGRSDFGPGRSKGGIYANGQGKPKKGRPTPRDAKRIRPSSEQDYDYEDDPDMM